MRELNKIIIHCSATPESVDVKTRTIKKWHLAQGWSDIGYHYIIELNGDIQIGRTIEKRGAHCNGYNNKSIGICYVGGVDKNFKAKDTRTEKQKESLRNLLISIKKQNPNITIHGHNEFSTKSCPSFDVKEEYKDI